MPGLQNGDDYRYHGTDDYSFVTRSDRSRDFARRRRFGNENDAQDPAMSQVSLPLRISRVGSSSRQGDSPYQDYYSPSRYMERRRSTSPQLDRSSRLSGAVRHALALCGELDEDDPYYRERTTINTPANYYEDDEDDEYVIVLQKRCKRPQSGRSFHEKDERRSQSRTRPIGLNEEEGSRWMERRQRPHCRGYGENTKEVTYTMPVTRKREEDEENIRESASYLAARKQFAVEDNADIEKLKNKKYEYRTKGPNPYFPETAVESLDKGNFAQAPMFVIKPRSHTIWEKMYVKFTCTVRGTPEPKVTWYHNMIAIDPSTLVPGTMRISNQFGVHTLEIFQASLDKSGTYRASAQNHKGEISSYATLIVRRYDGSKTGYYDVKSGYNLTKPTDFPDVEQLDIPDEVSEILKNHNEEKEVSNSREENCVHYSGKSVEVGDGKFESVLELRIPERKQSLEEKSLILDVQVKSKIKPVLITTKLFPACDDDNNNNSENNSGSIDVPCGATKELLREELSECLRDSIKEDDSNVTPLENDKDLVVEEIHKIEMDRKI